MALPTVIAVALMLPQVIQFNNTVARESYRQLYLTWRFSGSRVVALKQIGDLPNTLRECNVQYAIMKADLPILAKEASEQWTAQFNPRPLNGQDFHNNFMKQSIKHKPFCVLNWY